MPRDLPDGVHVLADEVGAVLKSAKSRNWQIATAESCTGGLIASLLTDVSGYGRCFDRGFVAYSDEAKCFMLGIEREDLANYGAVSAVTARRMADGALARCKADLAIAVTGFAGPAGPDDEVGLVYLATIDRSGKVIERECHFGDVGRERTRLLTAGTALEMMMEALMDGNKPGE